jgi:hypothetical protein
MRARQRAGRFSRWSRSSLQSWQIRHGFRLDDTRAQQAQDATHFCLSDGSLWRQLARQADPHVGVDSLVDLHSRTLQDWKNAALEGFPLQILVPPGDPDRSGRLHRLPSLEPGRTARDRLIRRSESSVDARTSPNDRGCLAGLVKPRGRCRAGQRSKAR